MARPRRIAKAAPVALAALVALAGCAGGVTGSDAPASRAAVDLPPMRVFGAPDPLPPQRPNAEMARDFLDLSFALESGAPLPAFSRFEEPIAIAVTGQPTPIFQREVDRLVDRLRSEAGLDIGRGAPGGAQITIEAIRQADLRRAVPRAACFVLPARISWEEFRADPRRRDLNWRNLRVRRAASVFIPGDASPQEIRDCLHEEVAQALGPLNDLWRLEDSVFNDDNLNSVLTGFDMLMLRTTYDPALASGMSRSQVAGRLPAILARLNPRGGGAAPPLKPTTDDWRRAIDTALTGEGLGLFRRRAAGRAVDIAVSEEWGDVRLGLSLFTAGRLNAERDGLRALEDFVQAGAVYERRASTQIHAAHVALQVAAFALAADHPEAALSIVERYAPAAERGENAALLADLLLIKAASLGRIGEAEAAEAALTESLGWGRYGFQSAEQLARRRDEIATLASDGGPS